MNLKETDVEYYGKQPPLLNAVKEKWRVEAGNCRPRFNDTDEENEFYRACEDKGDKERFVRLKKVLKRLKSVNPSLLKNVPFDEWKCTRVTFYTPVLTESCYDPEKLLRQFLALKLGASEFCRHIDYLNKAKNLDKMMNALFKVENFDTMQQIVSQFQPD